jgi:predicted membrane channel-forming protein YqfA (hemolysin III family)
MRAVALLLLLLGAVQDVSVILWYARARFIKPRKIWHVLSVGLGLLLAYAALALEFVRRIVTDAPTTILAPLIISSSLFLMFGVHALWAEARTKTERFVR